MAHDPMNDDASYRSLEQAMEHSDTANRRQRVERARWLGQFLRPPVVVARLESSSLLQEAREAYVFGQFVAVLLLATGYVEHSLLDMLVDRGKVAMTDGRLPRLDLVEIVGLAEKSGLIDAELRLLADQVRRLRNPFTHRRLKDDPDGLTARFLEQERHPAAILEEDAQKALRLMFAVFERVLRFKWRSSPLF